MGPDFRPYADQSLQGHLHRARQAELADALRGMDEWRRDVRREGRNAGVLEPWSSAGVTLMATGRCEKVSTPSKTSPNLVSAIFLITVNLFRSQELFS